MEYEGVPFSVEELENAGACQDELQRFAYLAMKKGYSYTEPIPLITALDLAEKCDGGIEFLFNKGFITQKSEKFDAEKFFLKVIDGKALLCYQIGKGEDKNYYHVIEISKNGYYLYCSMEYEESGLPVDADGRLKERGK